MSDYALKSLRDLKDGTFHAVINTPLGDVAWTLRAKSIEAAREKVKQWISAARGRTTFGTPFNNKKVVAEGRV